MTHVFVAPHPDDVALSCGGLIASLREVGQNVAIITVFSGNAGTDGTDQLPARGAGVRVEDVVAVDRGVQPQRDPARLPAADQLGGRRRVARGDPGRYRCGRQALLAAVVVVPTCQHPQRVAGRPAGHRRALDAGRGADRGGRRRGVGRRPDGAAPARRRALRLLRRGVDRVPRPARRGLPRLPGRRRSYSVRRSRATSGRPSSFVARSTGSSRSRSTSRSASAGTSTTGCAAMPASTS